MKKFLVLAAATAALSLGTGAASAANSYSPLCYMAHQKFVSHGLRPLSSQFAPKEESRAVLYTPEQVKEFFKLVNVEPENLDNLKPDQHYSVRFNCKTLRGLTMASLYIQQEQLPPNQVTPDTVTVSWEVTKINTK